MPPDVTSVALIICEKIETDAKGLCSAIRVADVYELDDEPVQAHALLVIKTEPNADSTREHELEILLFNSEGRVHPITNENEKVRYFASISNPAVHGGVTVVISLPLAGAAAGGYMLRVYLDGEEVSRAPIMLLSGGTKAASD
jgi:hypothetical protein